MKQLQALKFCDVIDRASHHLRESHQLSEKTVKKHKDNWYCLLDFAESQGLFFVGEPYELRSSSTVLREA